MIAGAAPSILLAGKGTAPFLISLFLLAFGAGIFKPNVAPTIIDQYAHQKEYVTTTKGGERVIVDPEQTIQRLMLLFYSAVNAGAFIAIATTYMAKYNGFWIAYLLPGTLYFLLPIFLLAVYKKLIIKRPRGSALGEFLGIIWTALRQNKFNVFRKDFLAAAYPARIEAQGGQRPTWNDRAVEDVRRTLSACMVFLYFPIYNINDGGVGNIQTNQGAAMTSDGAPNDLLVRRPLGSPHSLGYLGSEQGVILTQTQGNFNPLTIIVVTPILTYIIYPFLARRRIRFGPIRRLTFGFLLAAISGVLAGILQWRVYETSPCGYEASTCEEQGVSPSVSPINIWWQIPMVVLGALSEVFCNVTAYEMAYARSPPHLKAVVMSILLLMNALSSALGLILVPVLQDPMLVVSDSFDPLAATDSCLLMRCCLAAVGVGRACNCSLCSDGGFLVETS
jgi:proton-dependent oligopeptide transporter, POT family